MKLRDYLGRSVRLRRSIETRNGNRFAGGDVLKVTSYWRGKFTLEDPKNFRRVIRQVDPAEVKLLPVNPE